VFLAAHQGLALASGAAGLLLALLGLWASQAAWARHRHSVDGALGAVAVFWLLHLIIVTAMQLGAYDPLWSYAADLSVQTLVIAISCFWLASAGLWLRWTRGLLALQAATGFAAMSWNHWGLSGDAQLHAGTAWVSINLLGAFLFTVAIAWWAYWTQVLRAWLALAGSLIAIALCADDVIRPGDAPRTILLAQHFYAAFVLVMWHLTSQRGEAEEPAFEGSSGFFHLTGNGHSQDLTESAVAGERRRIAQDLHDGVGSQIVSILSSLDSHAPQQQAVAMALENCLLDLKMTVDAIDSASDNVIESLGRLRYRVQHSLDKLGIQMDWRVEICDELEGVRGEPAQQALRIAQESLSNVMRHSAASAVQVVCRFNPAPDRMVLEVRDNGQGIPQDKACRTSGKGFVSMRRRSKSVGGELLISSRPGLGTRVRFVLPLTQDHYMTA
jgi:signal transduction histidine kinase